MMGNTEDTSQSPARSIYTPAASATAADRKLSTAVVEAVAETAGVDPTELGTSLYDCIDPDALDALFAPTYEGAGREGGTVRFEMAGYEVTVSGDSLVEVTDAPPR